MTIKDAILLMVKKAELEKEVMENITAKVNIIENDIERIKYNTHAERRNQYHEIAEMLSALDFMFNRKDGRPFCYGNIGGKAFYADAPVIEKYGEKICICGFKALEDIKDGK